ncbi:phosphoadenylyl-sulfate reductase [Neisseriaceae bacterium TC5R-5]|nr:phosphoadenylyl-sulfate reductase [Neisseriaceae bacterium TC5R-5]
MSLEMKLATTKECLFALVAEYPDAILANSYGAEDMVLMDLIASLELPIAAFSLDTGRLPTETYVLMQQVVEHYPRYPITVYFPQTSAIEDYVNRYGVNAFYDSVELRKSCCHIRKIEPLKRALAGRSAWITGLRREQSPTRENVQISEFDAHNGLQKFSPLLEWTQHDVWAYLHQHQVPYNALHDRHYPSIGCAPCTRAISVGEDIRAGRWWWENPDSKECGLHVKSSPLQRSI